MSPASIPVRDAGPSQLEACLAGLRTLKNLGGLVVTIPHKEAVLSACGVLTGTARMVGSVNAMRFDSVRDRWIGGNFDGEGFVTGLREQRHGLAGKRVLQLGAGGAGKAMAFAIGRERPAELVIYNRSSGKATELVERLKQALPDLALRTGDNDPSGFDVIVNATSLGLNDTDELPLADDRLKPGMLVCEAVVRDADTRLLARARAQGCQLHHGHHMLYGQIVAISRFLNVPLEQRFVERIRALGTH